MISKLGEVFIFLVPALYFISSIKFQLDYVIFIVVASLLGFLNYVFLTKAYRYGDFSLVYPISRSGVLFLPLLTYLFIDERINASGLVAIVLIVTGVLVMHLGSFDRRGLLGFLQGIKNVGSIYAVLAALAMAGYTIWDKVSVSIVHPFVYYYLYNSLVAILYTVFVLAKYRKLKTVFKETKLEWRATRFRSILAGFLNTSSYMLVLLALIESKASYIGALRLLSIVLGVFFAYKLLGERLSAAKIVGILLAITGGCLVFWMG